jgi:hypothetical protein
MDRFHIIEEAAVILRTKGVWKQAKVYIRGQAIYASAGGGFVRLYKGGGTSVPNLSWDDIEIDGGDASTLVADVHGKLSASRNAKLIAGATK